MAVIERLWLVVLPEDRDPEYVFADEDPAHGHAKIVGGEVVEYVRADLARGAVEELEKAREDIASYQAQIREADEQLRGAVETLEAVRVWMASPQDDRMKVRGIRRALDDREYAAQIAAGGQSDG